MIHTCNLRGLYELCKCISSNIFVRNASIRKICGFVVVKCVIENMTYPKIYICNHHGLYEMCECVSSHVVLEKRICHKTNICDLSDFMNDFDMSSQLFATCFMSLCPS